MAKPRIKTIKDNIYYPEKYHGSSNNDYDEEIALAEAGGSKTALRLQQRSLPLFITSDEQLSGGDDENYIRQDSVDVRYFSEEKDKFRQNLLTCISEEPIEDGYIHHAEKIIEDALNSYPNKISDWIQSIFYENISNSEIASSILRCVGRLECINAYPWGYLMVIGGLKNTSVEIRDAAVRAIENWKDTSLVKILQDHEEKVDWLDDYIKQLIIDFSE